MKRLISVLFALMAVLVLPTVAFAIDIPASETGDWNVTFRNAGNSNRGEMIDDYSKQEYVSQVSRLQPGDTINFKVNMHHEHSESADWYMRNEVIKTLEELTAQSLDINKNAAHSAYTYVLTYHGPNGDRTLYDSELVGGDQNDAGKEGLGEATVALDDQEYIYLDTLSKGGEGYVTLRVGLDGETEGNAYFDTLAKLKIGFAVELAPETPEKKENKTTNRTVNNERALVKTGDDVRLFPFYVLMLVSGLLLAALTVVSVRERRRGGKEQAR